LKDKNHVILIRPAPMKDAHRVHFYIPLGPLYLAESLIGAGYDVSIVDDYNEEALSSVDRLFSDKVLCFGISTMSGTQLSNALTIARALRARYPDIPLVWGGVHVTALSEQVLSNKLADYIVWGEGEASILPLLDAIRRQDRNVLRGVPGIGFKANGELHIGGNSGYTSLDRVFQLPYHLINMDRYYRVLSIGAKKEYPVWTSRGCPFRCKYCSNSSATWPNTRVRFHSLDHIVNDIRTLVNIYGADMITFADECFLINQQRFLDILKAVREDGITVKYRFTARVDLLLQLKEKTWEQLREYGVVHIGSAPESGSQRILTYLGKKTTLEQIYRLDELLTKYGFFKSYNIMICTPRETRDDMKLTLRLVCDLARTSTSSPYPFGTLNKYIPLPGTELYEDAIRCGFVPPADIEEWGKFDFDHFKGHKDVVRPWIKESDHDFIWEAIELVEKLNARMKGKETDLAAVQETLSEIERLISS